MEYNIVAVVTLLYNFIFLRNVQILVIRILEIALYAVNYVSLFSFSIFQVCSNIVFSSCSFSFHYIPGKNIQHPVMKQYYCPKATSPAQIQKCNRKQMNSLCKTSRHPPLPIASITNKKV